MNPRACARRCSYGTGSAATPISRPIHSTMPAPITPGSHRITLSHSACLRWHNLPEHHRPSCACGPRDITGLSMHRGICQQGKQGSLEYCVGIAIGFWRGHWTCGEPVAQHSHQLGIVDASPTDNDLSNRPAWPDEALIVVEDGSHGEGRARAFRDDTGLTKLQGRAAPRRCTGRLWNVIHGLSM